MTEPQGNEQTAGRRPCDWADFTASLRAIASGLFVAIIALNVWPLLLVSFPVLLASLAEAVFLLFLVRWTRGGGPPRSRSLARATLFRSVTLSPRQWVWGLCAALFIAVTVHAAIVLLFRFVPFPVAMFRNGYDLSFIHSQFLKWAAILMSAVSAGICEEIGFRGYMQQPIERRYGVAPAVLISSIFFTAAHLTKAWSIPGMTPIVFGAGVLLGLLAWSARSLLPGIIGHIVMDIGLFAYWWTGIAGEFSAHTISETGVDRPFVITCFAFVASLGMVLLAMHRLRRMRPGVAL
jgi:membrane protease YdiL (CAAX protease family)